MSQAETLMSPKKHALWIKKRLHGLKPKKK